MKKKKENKVDDFLMSCEDWEILAIYHRIGIAKSIASLLRVENLDITRAKKVIALHLKISGKMLERYLKGARDFDLGDIARLETLQKDWEEMIKNYKLLHEKVDG